MFKVHFFIKQILTLSNSRLSYLIITYHLNIRVFFLNTYQYTCRHGARSPGHRRSARRRPDNRSNTRRGSRRSTRSQRTAPPAWPVTSHYLKPGQPQRRHL